MAPLQTNENYLKQKHDIILKIYINTATATHKMLESVYRNEALSCMHVFEWFNRFREGCKDLEDDPRCMGHQQHDIHKQLQKFMNWWPETVYRP